MQLIIKAVKSRDSMIRPNETLEALERAYDVLQPEDLVPGVLACEDATMARALLEEMEGLRKLSKIRMA